MKCCNVIPNTHISALFTSTNVSDLLFACYDCEFNISTFYTLLNITSLLILDLIGFVLLSCSWFVSWRFRIRISLELIFGKVIWAKYRWWCWLPSFSFYSVNPYASSSITMRRELVKAACGGFGWVIWASICDAATFWLF